MKHIVSALLVTSLLLSACGKRDEGSSSGAVVFGPNGEVISGAGAGTDPVSLGLSVQATTNANTIRTGGSDTATITALVTNSANLAVAGEPVAFAATGGVLQDVAVETDERGEATAQLGLAQSYENEIITVTVLSGTSQDVVNIEAEGTKIEFVGTTSVVLGDTAELSVKLIDGQDQPIANEAIIFDSAARHAMAADSPVTDSNGRVTLTVSGIAANDTITATALGTVIGRQDITVSSDIISFVTPAEGTKFPVGTVNAVEVEWLSNNNPVVGQQLRFDITAGQIISNNVVSTDSSGRATIQITSSSAGSAIISVSPESTGEPVKKLGMAYVATTPSSVEVTSTNSRVPTTESADIVAFVTDINGNPVDGQEVVFSSSDLKGGQLNPATTMTDIDGKASIQFTAGSQATEFDEIEIVAQVGNNISASHRLTVVEKVLNITLGTSGLLDSIAGETQYGLPFAVQVADGSGTPLEGAAVQLSITPTRYFKGTYESGLTSGVSAWVRDITATCESEDLNGNRILDPGEDQNNNGILDPQDPALIAAHLTNTPTVEGGTIRTDSNGSGYFTLVYPASSAHWAQVDIVARVQDLGTEAEETFHAYLPVLADRINDLGSNPPNINSPYGQSDTCTDEL